MNSKPILTVAAIVAVINTFILMAVSLGWLDLDGDQIGYINAFVVALMSVVFPLAGAWYANRKVTPLANPKDVDGEPLTRSDNSPAIRAR